MSLIAQTASIISEPFHAKNLPYFISEHFHAKGLLHLWQFAIFTVNPLCLETFFADRC